MKCQVNEKGAEPKEVTCPPHSKYCNYIDRNGVVTRNCSSGKGKWPSIRCVKLSWFTSCLCKGDSCNIRCSWDNCKKIAISRRVNSGVDKTMYNCNANCKAKGNREYFKIQFCLYLTKVLHEIRNIMILFLLIFR